MAGDIMEKDLLSLCTVLLIFSLPGILTNTGLDGKAFVFSKLSANSHVLLKPNLDQGLRQLTLCLRFFTDLTRSFLPLLSCFPRPRQRDSPLATPLQFQKMCGWGVRRFPTSHISGKVSLPLGIGVYHLGFGFRDGPALAGWEALAEERGNEGYEVKAGLVVMLGQDQDSYGGRLDVKQSLVGEIAEVYFWDKVLPAVELNNFQAPMTPRPLLDWTSLKFEIRGYVLTELL